ncbi:hypothetical protein [Streptomyces sp. NPDC058295]|uniref:hypothetical protein n=1 Tax=Streptomyces sp. NPDC058295 TaxID=3346431 RepID=UPI0036EABF68
MERLGRVAKETYTASLGKGVVPRPLMMPLVRGELVGLIWVRPLKVGQDALAGIAELANIAAAVAWLADTLASFGAAPEPGHLVLPGTMTGAPFVEAGRHVEVRLGGLGAVSVTFV